LRARAPRNTSRRDIRPMYRLDITPSAIAHLGSGECVASDPAERQAGYLCSAGLCSAGLSSERRSPRALAGMGAILSASLFLCLAGPSSRRAAALPRVSGRWTTALAVTQSFGSIDEGGCREWMSVTPTPSCSGWQPTMGDRPRRSVQSARQTNLFSSPMSLVHGFRLGVASWRAVES
jgi:hypothetical protein